MNDHRARSWTPHRFHMRLCWAAVISFKLLLVCVVVVVPDAEAASDKTADMQEHEQDDDDQDPWARLGGGAINEKPRQRRHQTVSVSTIKQSPLSSSPPLSSSSNFNPSMIRSHLWHALEGLDRYPNYLSRWALDDIHRLEVALEEQVAKVRQQRALVMDRRAGITKLVRQVAMTDTVVTVENDRWRKLLLQPPTSWSDVRNRILDPKASAAIFGSRMFTADTNINTGKSTTSTAATQTLSRPPTVSQVIKGEIDVVLDASQLESLIDEEFFDVFSFRLLSLSFCRDVREYVSTIVQKGQEDTNALLLLGRRPVDLDAIGLGWINDLLFHLFVRPISRQLFQSSETLGELDWRQGYIAGYSAQPTEGKARERLAMHTDDSEVTLNVCLGDDDFTGGCLEFRGLRGADAQGELVGTFQPQPGLALLHAGRHFHLVTQVTSGDRFALIVWARSWNGVRSQTCPCCWLNRRRDSSCVCGPQWN
jgi:hypothetical protein